LGIKTEEIINKIPSQRIVYKGFINIPKMDGKIVEDPLKSKFYFFPTIRSKMCHA
jgi:hypothetical protein